MEIIKDWTTIRCPWCHEVIDFVKYHQSGKPDIFILGLNPDKILQWEMDVSFESLKPLFSNFLAVSSKLLNQELHVFVPRPEAREHKEHCLQIILHYPDCLDYFTLNVANIFNDRLVGQRNRNQTDSASFRSGVKVCPVLNKNVLAKCLRIDDLDARR